MDTKILVGTPIHIAKDYCMDEWLAAVKQRDFGDLLLVDNSPDEEYWKVTMREKLAKAGIDKFTIVHVNVDQSLVTEAKVALSREYIRIHALRCGYEKILFWECDIIPNDRASSHIVEESIDHDMVLYDYPLRNFPDEEGWGFGFAMVKTERLKDLQFGTHPEGNWRGDEMRVLKKVLHDGGEVLEFHGLLDLQHLEANG